MNVLLVHDDTVLAQLLAADLGGKNFDVEALVTTAVTDATLQSRCTANDAVVYVSTGWDAKSAEREVRQVAVIVTALGGSDKRLLYVSDASVIGDTGSSFGNEDSPRSLQAPHLWRAAIERKVTGAVSVGIHPVIVRLALVHGRGGGELLHRLVAQADKTGEAVYVGDGAGRVSTVYIDDVVSLIEVALLRGPQGAVFVAASDDVVSWRDLATMVASANVGGCESVAMSEADAHGAYLDAATMTMSTVIRDASADRRLGWRATGPRLDSAALRPTG